MTSASTPEPRVARPDGGFTLIEIAVVILIIGVLLAIAIPNFLGVREKADDSVAKQSIQTSRSLAAILYEKHQDFAIPASEMNSLEPNKVHWDDGTTGHLDSIGPSDVVMVSAGGALTMSTLSNGGTCLYMRMTSDNITYKKVLKANTSGLCRPSAADAATGSWTAQW